MALIVETGEGVAGAESYSSVADADTYWSLRGGNTGWADSSNAEKEAGLRRATTYLDQAYTYRGCLLDNTQALGYPRTLTCNSEGRIIGGPGVVPVELKNACIELAAAYTANSFADPSGQSITSETIGDSSFSYGSAVNTSPELLRVSVMLRGIAVARSSAIKLRRG